MKPVIKEGQYEYNLDEIAEALQISRSTANETQRSALRKLRKALEQRGYTADDFLEACDEKHSVADRSIK